jgi:hypothetical protein
MGSPGWSLQLGPLHDGKLAITLAVHAKMEAETAIRFQADAEAITRLHTRGLIGDVAASAYRHKLHKRIMRVVEEARKRPA